MSNVKETQVELTLPNGLGTLKGTPTQVAELAKRLGVDVSQNGDYYLSSTKGLVRVADMDGNHLRNALLKLFRARLDEIQKETDFAKVVKVLTDYTDNKQIVSMLFHLEKKAGK